MTHETQNLKKTFFNDLLNALNTRNITVVCYHPSRFELELTTQSLESGQSTNQSIKKIFFRLQDAYDKYVATEPEHRGDVIQTYLTTISKLFEPPSLKEPYSVKSKIRPIIRNVDYFRILNKIVKNHQAKCIIPSVGLTHNLAIGLVVDKPNAFSVIDSDTLHAWNISFDDLYDIAIKNLKEISPIQFTTIKTGLYRSGWNDFYDSSRLLLPETWSHLEIKGEYLIAIPNPHTLLVTGTQNTSAEQEFIFTAWDAFQTPKGISPVPLRYANQQWVSYEKEFYQQTRKQFLFYMLQN